MDWLDRIEANEERFRAVRRPEPSRRIDEPPKTTHNITIIGCIRGVDGWYRAGFDLKLKLRKLLRKARGESEVSE